LTDFQRPLLRESFWLAKLPDLLLVEPSARPPVL
jgi:hypothetical protein